MNAKTKAVPDHDVPVNATLYRVTESLCEGGVRLCVDQYTVLKVTKRGYWIAYGFAAPSLRSEDEIFILARDLKATRFVNHFTVKRFAHPTVEQAIEAYRARKNRQVRLLNAQLKTVHNCLTALYTYPDDLLHNRAVAYSVRYPFQQSRTQGGTYKEATVATLFKWPNEQGA